MNKKRKLIHIFLKSSSKSKKKTQQPNHQFLSQFLNAYEWLHWFKTFNDDDIKTMDKSLSSAKSFARTIDSWRTRVALNVPIKYEFKHLDMFESALAITKFIEQLKDSGSNSNSEMKHKPNCTT